MAYQGQQSSTNFFAAAMNNRLALLPGSGNLTTYGNGTDGATAAAGFNSRVLASQINGAGPVASPINAPWSFSSFATGKKILTGSNSSLPKRSSIKFR
jgi:hypothetical protein